MIPGSAIELLLKANDYQISRSLRFNSADSPYLLRTAASNGSLTTWTWASWVKIASATTMTLFSSSGTNAGDTISIKTSRLAVDFFNVTANALVDTNALLRDYSAWYHFVVACDTTQATASNRIKIYINGIQASINTATYPAQNYQTNINSANPHAIGRENRFPGAYCACYMTDVYFIDGQALDALSFGRFDSNNVWQPKRYGGSYGTNGFLLNFEDNSSTTSLGNDISPNNNDFTSFNFSVTAGPDNDSLVDVPTGYGSDSGGLGGQVRGNYATLNPIYGDTFFKGNGNLNFSTQVADMHARATFGMSSGRWYWEIVSTTNGNTGIYGIVNNAALLNNYVGQNANGYGYSATGSKINNNVATAYGATFTTNDVIGVEFDADAGNLIFYKNGVSQGTAFTGLTSGPYFPAFSDNTSLGNLAAWVNFGQRPYIWTALNGAKALCSHNVNASTIPNGLTVCDSVLYTGTGSAFSPTTSLLFSPDLVWIKNRNTQQDHALYDTIRGAQNRLNTGSNATQASLDNGLTSFNSNGFTLGTLANVNTLNNTYVGWCWDAGSSQVGNNAGTISSQVRVNDPAGFSVVTYLANGVNSTVGHGLGPAPDMIILKAATTSGNWSVYHKSIGAGSYIQLNGFSPSVVAADYWNNTLPTAAVFSIGTNANVNTNSFTYVAYCFNAVAGYSAFGSYVGNGSTEGPFVYTGFRPSYLVIKNNQSGSSTNWQVFDYARIGYNPSNYKLSLNTTGAESTTATLDFTSNGFKIRTTAVDINTNNSTYIYFAFAENPFQISRAV